MTTVQQLADGIFEEWLDDRESGRNPHRFVTEAISDAVPCMTTALFQMVVEDNSLAFLDAPCESGEPFTVLSLAIGAEVERLAIERIQAFLADESESK